MTLEALVQKLNARGRRPHSIVVHPDTYRDIVGACEVAGVEASMTGFEITTSASVLKGEILCFDVNRIFPAGLPKTTNLPADPNPYDQITSISLSKKPLYEGTWEARDRKGQLLMELTFQGAKEISERTGIPLT